MSSFLPFLFCLGSYAFDQGSFCETFHSDNDGWRKCESCGKVIYIFFLAVNVCLICITCFVDCVLTSSGFIAGVLRLSVPSFSLM